MLILKDKYILFCIRKESVRLVSLSHLQMGTVNNATFQKVDGQSERKEEHIYGKNLWI